MAVKRVIKLLGEPIQTEEDKAASAITPGMLLSYDGSGDWVPHATAAGVSARVFAMHREEGIGVNFGAAVSGDIDTPYAIGDYVKAGAFAPGQRVNALLHSGQTVTKGTFLESAGNGYLRTYGSGVRVAMAQESVNNSAGLTPARIRITVV